MGTNTKKRILKAWRGAKDVVKGAGETIKNYSATLKTAPAQKKLAKDMMERYYPSYTVTGVKKHAQREKETFKKIKQGNIAGAREDLKKLAKKFKEDN